jgi:hypothetical protein
MVSLLAAACVAGAQTPAPESLRQSITGEFVYGVKAGPNGGVSYPLLNDAPGFSISYSFRPRPWLALEAGFEQIVRPIGSSVCCEYAKSADDELYLAPFGARYVWQARGSRVRLTIGGGGAYLNHAIGQEAGGAFGFSGWGGQAVASGDYAVTRSGRLRVGWNARYYFASPKSSPSFGPVNPSDTLHLFAMGPAVTFSFH